MGCPFVARIQSSTLERVQYPIPKNKLSAFRFCFTQTCLLYTTYTKTIQFQDINYQLSQNEDKTAIFEGWCDFLNYFDSSIHFQLSFLNLAASEETFANSISIPPQRDAFDSIREEYTTMLQNQLARGNHGLIKTKYLTFGIDADSIKAAKPRLERIETDILLSLIHI